MRRLRLVATALVLVIALWQARSFATHGSAVPARALGWSQQAEHLLDQQEIARLELEARVAGRLGNLDEQHAHAADLTARYTARIEDPASSRQERAAAKEALAELMLRTGDREQARAWALAALEEQPRLRDASGVLVLLAIEEARALARERRHDEAIQTYKQALELPLAETWQAMAESRLALLYVEQRNDQAAILAYEDLIIDHPALPEWRAYAQWKLGELYHRQDDLAKARESLNAVLTRSKHFPWMCPLPTRSPLTYHNSGALAVARQTTASLARIAVRNNA